MSTQVDLKELEVFIVEAHQHGYAAGDKSRWIKESDGSTSIHYERDQWKYHDNFFGGEPFGGREMVFFEGQAVWMMAYYGGVEEGEDSDQIYSVLRFALLHPISRLPLRGPEGSSILNGYEYDLDITGVLGHFELLETIGIPSGRRIYSAYFFGGLIAQRSDD